MKDNLARKIYAEKIAEEISAHYDDEERGVREGTKKERENIVFAISGKWGEGKTALLRLLEEPLVKKEFKIIWFNPWKYSQEDITLKRAFLGSLKEQLKSHVDLDDLYFDRTKTSLNFDWRLVVRWSLAGSFLYFLVLPALFGFSVFEWLAWSSGLLTGLINLPLIKPLLTLILIPVVLEIITISRRGANVSTAEEFEEKFKELLKEHKKIVIFVDDLDRCTPKTVKVILDSLRTFFQHPECSYIITGDHTVVERYAGDELELPDGTSEAQKLQEGRRFLKKLFDVYWRLPLPTPFQFGIFVDEELKTSKITLNDQQAKNLKAFVIDDNLFERNPRHVKRFLTKLRFALEGVSLQIQELEKTEQNENTTTETKSALTDILENLDLLAKILLIEEFFYPVYEKLILNPEDLVYHEKSLRNDLESAELKVGDKLVLDLLDKKTDELMRYASLIRKPPKFTDENNSTIHEVANFMSFSGSTGLPSTLGPDEANFEQYLKAGQLIEKLGKILDVSGSEKRKQFVKKSQEIFTKATEVEKPLILRESLVLATSLDEWSEKMTDWKKHLDTLPDAEQNSLMDEFWSALLQKQPSMIDSAVSAKPDKIKYLWSTLESIDESVLHDDTVNELQKLVTKQISERPPIVKGAEVFASKFGDQLISNELETQLTNPETCKTFLEGLRASNALDGVIVKIVKKKLANYLNNFSNVDWLIANKDYLKPLGLFESAKSNVKKWVKDVKQFTRIAEIRDQLDLSDEEKREIGSEIINLTKKSANLEFLDQANTHFFLDKENRKKCFEALQDVLSSNDDALEKRKQSAELLVKTKALWNDVEKDDVYESLKKIKKLRLGRIPDLKDKPREIIESWGFDDTTEKEE